MKIDALFFAAYPDDAELSCGGTIVKLVNAGKKVGIIDLTRGELGTRGSKEIRYRELKNASMILKLAVRENLNIKDGNIENNHANKLKIIKVIRKYLAKLSSSPTLTTDILTITIRTIL